MYRPRAAWFSCNRKRGYRPWSHCPPAELQFSGDKFLDCTLSQKNRPHFGRQTEPVTEGANTTVFVPDINIFRCIFSFYDFLLFSEKGGQNLFNSIGFVIHK